MSTRIILLLLLNFLVFCPVNASVYIKQPIKKHIEKAQLIVKGVIIDKTTKNEEHYRKYMIIDDGKKSETQIIQKSPYTTFILKIDEILFGSYDKNEIAVKMLGGCTTDGVCMNVSYNYEFQTKEEVLIFLNFDETNDFYFSTGGGITAFRVNDNGDLQMTKVFKPKNNPSPDLNNKNNELISIKNLKSEIEKVLNEK